MFVSVQYRPLNSFKKMRHILVFLAHCIFKSRAVQLPVESLISVPAPTTNFMIVSSPR